MRDTWHLTKLGLRTTEVRQLIQRRRLQLLVHSYLYYHLDTPLIQDYQWDQWAQELVELQAKYPKISSKVCYAKEFKDFEGSTGYDLPYIYPEVRQKAEKLLNLSVYKSKKVSYTENVTKIKGGHYNGKKSKMVRKRNRS